MTAKPALVLRQVDKSYTQGAIEHPVLAQLNLVVGRGEQVSIVGRSASNIRNLKSSTAARRIASASAAAASG